MNKHLLLALLAVFASGLFNAAIYILWVSGGQAEIGFLLIMSIVGGAVVLGITIVWGLPLYFLLKIKGIQSFPKYLAIGAVPSLIIPIDHMLGARYGNLVGEVIFMCYVGMVAATVFWCVERRNA
jgi:hypothetical protein